MELRCEKVRDVQVVHVKGRIDGITADEFGQDIGKIIEDGDCNLLLDLAAVPYINSAGLRMVLAAAKSAKKHGGRCDLSGLSDEVRNIFELAGFTRILRIHSTVDDAVSRW